MRLLIVSLLIAIGTCQSMAQGMPFLRNFTSDEYRGHNYNFDITIGPDGTIYVANFEGLMYYDQVEWRLIHTPGITRITVVYRDEDDNMWAGGYNYFGRIMVRPNGELYLKRIGPADLFRGELQEMWEKDGQLYFLVDDGKIYKVKGDEVSIDREISKNKLKVGMSDIVETEALEQDNRLVIRSEVTQTLINGLIAVVKQGHGITIVDKDGKEMYSITEANGLSTNNVEWIDYGTDGILWGASDNGIFSIAVPSAFTRFTSNEGLLGEVLTIEEYGGTMYVGTTIGLYRQKGMVFEEVKGIKHGCWKVQKSTMGLLAATSSGVYRIDEAGNAKQLTMNTATALLCEEDQYYTGEMDGVYLTQMATGKRHKVLSLERVMKILKDSEGGIWLQSLYGETWHKAAKDNHFKPVHATKAEEAATLVPLGNKVVPVPSVVTEPFPYPLFSYLDRGGVTWLTDGDSKQIYRWKDGKRLHDMDRQLYPLSDMVIHAMYQKGTTIWFGGAKGVIMLDTSQKDASLDLKPKLLFRSITLNGDSILWGGFGTMPKSLPELSSNDRNLRFTYAIDHKPLVGKTLYRYRLNNDGWSPWDEDNDAEFLNLPYGSYTIQVQAKLASGELSEVTTVDFKIAYPFYMRWYMTFFYTVFIVLLVYGIFRYRLHRLKLDKERLAKIVEERTVEVVKQKDEIEEKSKSLEKALDELSQAQHELIRQEKMATVGKLTQGLIDRILNPLNYINNFSKLSEGLVKDLEDNIEDVKDNMDEEIYQDTREVLDMLQGNLQKVGEHGQNTTRTLKAMEEMLKDRSGGIVPMDLVPILVQDEKMLNNYYAKEIKEYGIKATFNIPLTTIPMKGNADQLSKTLMSLLGNSVYAVVRKAQRQWYQPEVSLSVSAGSDNVNIVIRDNGTGIESTIIEKIFDPFFTTKTTSEAAGVGLYLSHEIIQNHGGSISVRSEKDAYTEFTITLPTS